MPKAKPLKIQGWVRVGNQPRQTKPYEADVSGASMDALKEKAGGAPKKNKVVGKTKLRGVYVRPVNGDDSQAKLVVVDEANRPHFAQG